jgi:PadR family transcriptional regulator, regulatory protein PadR
MENSDSLVQNVTLELRRGAIVLAVLSQLDQEQYGYSLLKRLSDQGLEVEQGTLYPLLRRLEAQGLLQSDWRIADEARPRRYYVISPQGRMLLVQLTQEWSSLAGVISGMLASGSKSAPDTESSSHTGE